MKRYKYYFKSDSLKESIGKVYASNIESAIIKASNKKKLSIEHFNELFNVEKL